MLIFPQLSCLKLQGQQGGWEYCYSWVGFSQSLCEILVQVWIWRRAAGVWLLPETKARLCTPSPARSHTGRARVGFGSARWLSWRSFAHCFPHSHNHLLFSLTSMSLRCNCAFEGSLSAGLGATETVTPSDIFVPPQLKNSGSIQLSKEFP